MFDWIAQSLAAVRRGERLAMVTVVGARGSTPRELGARMLVWPDRFSGTIGGGSLERQGLEQARKLLAQDQRRHALQDYPLGPLLGQCCGGHVRLLVETLDGASQLWLADAERACIEGRPFELEAVFSDGSMTRRVFPSPLAGEGGSRWLTDEGSRSASNLGQEPSRRDQIDPSSDPLRGPPSPARGEGSESPEVRRISETIRPARPRLVIFGAGHVGQAVARAFAPLEFHLYWLASREDLRPEASGTRATILSEDDLEEAVAAAPSETLFAIFTHSHDLDYRLSKAALARGDFGYLGLIGSATKRARFERRFRADGITEEALARLTCPIGIPGLKSKAPAVIAVALAAQLLQLTEDEPT